ncbi:MAG: DUF4234 domain-containing protein [Eubacterium sp.]|nr:DUF4234 domain-containing protein [Eubacterium sp.]
MLQNRSVAMVIILTIVTCGIYGLYWVYDTMHALEQTSGKESSVNAIACLLLCIFVAPVGFILFGNGADEQLNMIKAQRGIPTTDNKVMYMILGFFLPIVLIPIVQDEVNKLV